MRVSLFSVLLLGSAVTLVQSYASKRTPLKTKKYKCIEIEDDEADLTRRPSGWDKSDEELRPIGSARLAPPEMPRTEPPPPSARPHSYGNNHLEEEGYGGEEPFTPRPRSTTPSSFISPMAPPRDSKGNPLILSPEHCAQVKHYAGMYGVKDVLSWVHGNCQFAKMYLPSATCEEINILVGSCYPAQGQQQQPRYDAPQRPTPPPAQPMFRRAQRPTRPPAPPTTTSTTMAPLFNWGGLKGWFTW